MFVWLFSNTTLTLLTISIAIAYFYVKFVYSYWRCRGVSQLQPSFPFGNFGNFSRGFPLKPGSIGEQVSELYRRTTEPFIGVYSFLRPTLIVRDPNLIRNILCNDFHHFNDGIFIDGMNEPISAHLLALTGQQWKNVRTKLATAFTADKMQTIFSTLLNCTNRLHKFVKKIAYANGLVDIGEMSAAFATNAIASIAFGIDVNCFSDPENPLRINGRKVFASSAANTFRLMLLNLCPKLLQWTGIRPFDRDVQAFFHDMVEQMLELRKKHDIQRNDFFNLLMQMHETGTVHSDKEWKTVNENEWIKALTIEQFRAQSYQICVAGIETIAACMSFCLYEISKNGDIQQRILDEIDKVSAQHRQQKQSNDDGGNANGGGGGGIGQFTYESIAALKYLDCCIDESLRKYSVVPILTRQCTKDYKIPGSNVTLEKGTHILIPIFSLQRDEKFYVQPEKFDPSRFFSSSSDNNNQNEKMSPYLPFGAGPRACLGRDMGKLLVKFFIANVLQKCRIELGDHQNIDHEFHFTPAGAFLRPKTGFCLRLITRKVLLSTHRVDFLEMIDTFSPGESEFSRAVRAAEPMRPIPKTQRPTIAAFRKRMSLR